MSVNVGLANGDNCQRCGKKYTLVDLERLEKGTCDDCWNKTDEELKKNKKQMKFFNSLKKMKKWLIMGIRG